MDSKTAFIISPIGPRGSEIRIHFDKVRKHIINPVAKEKDYTTLRSDEIALPGRITSQIIEHLKNDELVIADLSRKNPNVYYELAIRHAVHKPVILIGENVLDIPFDLAAQRVIPYSLDPDDIVTAKTQLKSQIESVESKSFVVDSPITDVIDLTQKLPRTEEDSMKRILAILETQSREIQQIKMDQRVRQHDTGSMDERKREILERSSSPGWFSLTMSDYEKLLRPREIGILRSLTDFSENGISINQISQILDLSSRSVNEYVRKLMDIGFIQRNDFVRPYLYTNTHLGQTFLRFTDEKGPLTSF